MEGVVEKTVLIVPEADPVMVTAGHGAADAQEVNLDLVAVDLGRALVGFNGAAIVVFDLVALDHAAEFLSRCDVRALHHFTQAFDTGGDSSDYQATPFSFTVDTQAPTVPTLLTPADLTITGNNTPTFDWSATAGAGGA